MRTYEEFISEADKAGVRGQLTEQDLQVAKNNPEYGFSMLQLLQDSGNAHTPEQQLIATEAANQLRKNYGVYAGAGGAYASSAGSKIEGLTDKLDNYGEFTYGKQDAYDQALQKVTAGGTYASSFGDKIAGLTDKVDNYGKYTYGNQDAYNQALQAVIDQQPFSYDMESDPVWDSYKKQYLREGDRATANALAKVSAATGGIPSSYAVTASQQAGNYYAAKLADMIPTLEQNAYSRYLSDVANNYNILNALVADRNTGYNEWLKGYEMLQNSLQNAQSQDATAYQQFLNQQANDYDILNALAADRNTGYNEWLKGYEMLLNSLQNAQSQDATDYQRYLTTPAGTEGNIIDSTGTVVGGNAPAEYDTHGYSTEEIKAIQRAAGIAVDGIWGPDTQKAYEAGYRPETVGDSDITYDSVVNDLNTYIENGADKSEISNYLRAVYQEGYITQAEYNKLKEQYVPRGYTY